MFQSFNKYNEARLEGTFVDRLLVTALWLPSYPEILQYIFFIASEIQVIDILLYSQFKLILGDDDSIFKKILLKISATYPNDLFVFDTQNTGNNPLLIVTWMYFLVFLIMFSIIMRTFYLKKNPSSSHSLTVLGQFHLRLGFWVTNMILLNSLSRKDAVFKDRGTSLLADISSFVLVIFNYVIGAFYAIFSYNPFIDTSMFATHFPIFQIQTFFFKAVISIIMTWFENSGSVPWILTISSFIIIIIRHYSLVTNFPFYEFTPMKITVITSSISLIISGMNLFALAIQSYSGNFFLVTEVSLIAFMIIITLNQLEARINRYYVINIDNLKSQKEVLKNFFALRYLFKNMKMDMCNDKKFRPNELDFWGALTSIRKQRDLVNLSNPTNFVSSGSGENISMEDFRKYHIRTRDLVIKGYLKMAIHKLKHTNRLKMILCCLSLQDESQVDPSIYYLTTISKPNGMDRIMTLSLRRQVQAFVDQFIRNGIAQDKRLDIRSYMDFENISVSFMQMIHSNCKKSLEFWQAYSKQNPKMRELYGLNIKIEKEYDEITRFWNTDLNPNKIFAKSLSIIYSIYLNLARNAPTMSKKIFDKYGFDFANGIQNHDNGGPLSESNLSSPYNITLYASVSQENLGAILYISPNAADLLGWVQDDLKRTNINALMPSFMHKGHDLMLLKHLKNVSDGFSSKRLYKNVVSFVRDKEGFIVPCYVYLSIYPFIREELVYSAMIRLKKSKLNIILLNEKGNIEGFTKGIGDLLGLKISKSVKMSDICENYKLVERVLYNLHQLMVQKVEVDLKKVKIQDIPTSDDFLRVQMEEAFDNVTQTIEIKFHPPGHHSSVAASRRFSVKISGKKLWNCYFYVLRLIINSNKVANPIKKEEDNITKVTEVQGSIQEENIHTSYTSQALLKVTRAAAQVQKLANENKKPDFIDRSYMIMKGSNYSKFMGPDIQSVGILDSSETASNLKQHKKAVGGDQAFDVEEIRSTSSVSMNKYNSALEKAVYMVPKDRKLEITITLFILYLVGTVSIFAIFWMKNNKVIENEKQNFEIVDESLGLLEKICTINREIRMFRMLKSDKLFNMTVDDTSRFEYLGFKVSPLFLRAIALQEKAQEANSINNNLRNSIYKIEGTIQDQFYQNKILILELDEKGVMQPSRALNIFDLTTKLISTVSEMSLEYLLESQFDSDPNILFILSNTFGSVLTVGEDISTLLVNDEEIRLNELLSFLLIIIGIMAAFGLVILTMFGASIKNFLDKRDKLIEIIRKMEINHVEKHMVELRKFIYVLEENQMDSKRVNLKIDEPNFSKGSLPKSKPSTSVKPSRKTVDIQGININVIFLASVKALLVVSVFLVYIVILSYARSQNEILRTNIQLVITSNFYLYQFHLLSTIIYEYIDLNATSLIRNKPIREEWDFLVSKISAAQNTLLPIFLEKDGLADHLLLQTISRNNLCTQIEIPFYVNLAFCNQIAGGVLQKGVIGYISYGLDTLDLFKSSFDVSQMSNQDKVSILGSKEFVNFEFIMDAFAPGIIRKFMDIVKTHVKEDTDGLDEDMRNVIVISIVCSVIIGGLVLTLIKIRLTNEVNGWRKIIRQIPWDIIISDKMLKSYIGQNSKHEFTQ